MTIEKQAEEVAASAAGKPEESLTRTLERVAESVQDQRDGLAAALAARNAFAREAVVDHGASPAFVAAMLKVSVSTVTKAIAEGDAL